MPVPAVEPVHFEHPQAGAHVGEHDQSIVVPHVHAERTLLDARRTLPSIVGRAAEAVLVLALAGVPGAVCLRLFGILQIKDL